MKTMLTIIIASNRPTNLQRIKENIRQTIGGAYELLHIDNLKGGLGKAYNEAAEVAASPFLCFVHDDVLFHTQGWGEHIEKQLEDEQNGIVGVMGSRYKSFFGAGWRDGDAAGFRMNVKDGAEKGRLLLQNPTGAVADEVVCLDGAFLCCSKAHWQAHSFDEKIFNGFHFYDLDFCLQMHKAGLKNLVTYAVVAEHFSQGNKDDAFLKNFLLFQKKWRPLLPQSVKTLPAKAVENFEGYALAETLRMMKKNGFSTNERRLQLKEYYKRHKRFYHLLRSFYFGFLK